MTSFSVLACVAIVGSAATAVAQQPAPRPSAPKSVTPGDACTTTEPGKVECRRVPERGFGARFDSALMKRAALGVQLSATGTARDTLGVFVASVTPRGPAENAGVIEGDRIMSINGVDLRVAAADVDDGYASGLPAHRLQREVAKLTPGSKVNLRVYAGGRVRDVQVTAGRASDLSRARTSISFGEGPGGYIFRDGMQIPMDMRVRELRPHLERFREAMPRMHLREPDLRRLREMMPEMRRAREPGSKARADSLKKKKKN